MTDERSPGPWGHRDGAAPPVPTAESIDGPDAIGSKTVDKGQHPAWAALSTLLLAAFVWWMSGSWVVAVAVVFGVFVHEWGHVLAMNRLGMGPARLYIVPFFGGLAKGVREPASEWDGVRVALAGPLMGLVAALPFFALWIGLDDAMWLLGALAIAMVNLVNLAPAPPLDGSKALGPVLARVHPLLEQGAMVLVAALVIAWGVTNGSWIFAAFLVLALIGHLRRGRWRPYGRPLTWSEAGWGLAAWACVLAACATVGLLAVAPLAGSLEQAAADGMRVLGIER